jgi:hypothetical protein
MASSEHVTDGTVSGVHLVGSVPVADAEQVFRAISAGLGDRVRRIPDGETGPRADWIIWQYPVLSSRPEFEICPPGAEHYRALPRLRLAEGVSAREITFERLGYAQTAIASYRIFATLKRDGIVPAHCRFQVSLPTPLAPISAFIASEAQSVVEPIYENRMLEEVESSGPYPPISWPSSGTLTSSSPCSRVRSRPGLVTSEPESWKGCCA